MLTDNCNEFSPASWGDFRAFVVALTKQFGAKAWAACLEKSLHSATSNLYHCHDYLLRTEAEVKHIHNGSSRKDGLGEGTALSHSRD